MSDFEQWFRSLNANGKTVYFLGNEHKVSEMAWNHQQAKIDGLKDQLSRIGYVDNGGQLMKPPAGKAPDFDLLDAKQADIDELQKRVDMALDLLVDGHMEYAEQALRGEYESN